MDEATALFANSGHFIWLARFIFTQFYGSPPYLLTETRFLSAASGAVWTGAEKIGTKLKFLF